MTQNETARKVFANGNLKNNQRKSLQLAKRFAIMLSVGGNQVADKN